MQPDRKIVRRHCGEKRLILRFVKRMAIHMGEDLNPSGAQGLDGAFQFLHGQIHIMHGERGDKGRESGRVVEHHVGHRVVRDARQIAALRGSCDCFERWIWYRKNLTVIAERVHGAKPRVQIMQFADGSHALHQPGARPQALHGFQ